VPLAVVAGRSTWEAFRTPVSMERMMSWPAVDADVAPLTWVWALVELTSIAPATTRTTTERPIYSRSSTSVRPDSHFAVLAGLGAGAFTECPAR
jgi:hypothetical protein